MRLNLLSNRELHDRLLDLATQERAITLEILHHLREVEHRRAFLEMGYPNLYEYAVRGLKYSEAAAQRRIASMRLLKELPELEEKLKTGEIKVTQVAQVQSFLRAEKGYGKSYSLEQKRELLQSTVGKSTRETEKLLVEKSPAYALRAGPLKEQVREVSATQSQMSFIADEELIQQLKQIRDRFAQRLPENATRGDVIRFMAKFMLENDPMLRKTRRETQKEKEKENKTGSTSEIHAEDNAGTEKQNDTEMIQPKSEQKCRQKSKSASLISQGSDQAASLVPVHSTGFTPFHRSSSSVATSLIPPPAPEVARTVQSDLRPADRRIQSARVPRPRTPPRSVLRQIWRRDYPKGCAATYGGKRCGSRHRLQADHYPIPYALGGSSTDPNNLRLVCFQCNQLAAQKIFGRFRS